MSRFDGKVPFDDLPNLPARFDFESTEIMRSCIRASRSLAELQGFVETLPKIRMLIELLLLMESESSSAIENVILSKQRLFFAASGDEDSTDRFTKEILGYNKALISASGHIPDLDTIELICSSIKGKTMSFRRDGDDSVVLYNPGSRKPVYTPPSSRLVPDLMRNLQEYIFTDDELDPLIKMAIIHYQFEAIHPFFDGNGRTGRILNVLYLQYSKLMRDPILFLSGYIIDNKKRYYELLSAVSSEGKWEQWVLFMLDAVDATSRKTMDLIRNITDLIKQYKEKARMMKIPDRCIDTIFSNPFCTIDVVKESVGCSKPTAIKYLHKLEELNFVKSSISKKSKVFENSSLLDLFSKNE